MVNPYRNRPDYTFWSRSVGRLPQEKVDPVTNIPFSLVIDDKIATAGSCFAQHISRTLAAQGFNYLVTEPGPACSNSPAENYGVYPARFGNIYSTRQLLQLFERAYGIFEPIDRAWRTSDGTWVDPFRPQIQAAGFASLAELEEDRAKHFAAVRAMFERCSVFVFTLGLTEAWHSLKDGAVFPLAPGVAGEPEDNEGYGFINFDVATMVADLDSFLSKFRTVNPDVKVILTVSPVPLVATYENQHVLVSTTYSKSALRVVAETVKNRHAKVAYFPSYEIITGPQSRGRYFEDDLRSVSPAGVAHVMSIFTAHFVNQGSSDVMEVTSAPIAATKPRQVRDLDAFHQVVCEEEALDPGE